MNSTKGAIHFEITASNEDLKRKLAESRQAILNSGKTAEAEGTKIEGMFKRATIGAGALFTVPQAVSFAKQIAVVRGQFQQLEVDTAKTTRDIEINKDADKELQEHQKSITDVFLNEESKRLAAIKERYDKEREWADEQFKGGKITAKQRDAYKSDVDKTQQHEELKPLLKKYQSYEQQCKEINSKFDSDETQIKNSSVLSESEKSAAIVELTKKRREAIKAVNNEEIEDMKKSSGLLVSLFEDASNKSVSKILKTTNTVEQLMSYLTNTEAKDITPQFGFTAEQLKILKESPETLKAVRTGVKGLNDEAVCKNPFKTLAKDLKNLFSAGNKDDSTEKELAKLGGSAAASAKIIGNLAGELSGMFEAMDQDELAGAMNIVQGVMSAIGNIGEGFAKGGLIGGIGAALGEIFKGIGALFKAGDKHKEKEIQRIQKQIDILEKSYNKLGKSVEKAYSTDAKGLIEDQNKMLEQQKVLIQNQIAEEDSKKNTDDEKIKQYQDRLEEIDETIEDNKEKALDAIFSEDLKSAIDNFATAYADAWTKGENRSKSAKDTVCQMMRQMVTESIKAAIQSSEAMEKIRKKLEEFYADKVLSGWEQDYIYGMAENLQKELDQQFGWADSLIKNDESEKDREASSKGLTSMSQDSADELNGRFTAMQGILFEVRGNQLQMLELHQLHLPNLQYLSQLSHLSMISENTAYCRRLAGIESDMSAVKGELQTINLKGIVIRK